MTVQQIYEQIDLYERPFEIIYTKEEIGWGGDGCVVSSYSSTEVHCACEHLTSFNVGGASLSPQINMLQISDFK